LNFASKFTLNIFLFSLESAKQYETVRLPETIQELLETIHLDYLLFVVSLLSVAILEQDPGESGEGLSGHVCVLSSFFLL